MLGAILDVALEPSQWPESANQILNGSQPFMSQTVTADLRQTAINTIRFLAVDMVEKANSGHPGAPMGQAAMAYLLWTKYLRHNPANPAWPNRDRFVLSCGHASALLYSLLHLSGYDLPMEELESFRQWGSKTPGHPEHGHTPGVETTTGPLGQGISNAVGMAIAERLLADTFNRDGFALVDHRVWVIASDGDLMEGVASEACSLAGHLALGKLNVLYDDNSISIDGSTDLAFTENVDKRFEAYGWHVERVEDGNDLDALDAACAAARDETARPSILVVRTHIGYGSPNRQDTAKAHGEPLGADEVRATKEALGWPLEPTFHVPSEVRDDFARAVERGAEAERRWNERRSDYADEHPGESAELDRRARGELPPDWHRKLPAFSPDSSPMATRKASGEVLNAIADVLPELVGGSADLAGSNKTYLNGKPDFTPATAGRNFYFGVREHGMGAVLNGMALSGMLRPYGGTFLIFSDYMRASVRLAALMGQPVIYVYTHDSIFLGEDGPTHQPISQLLSLRAIPGLTVLRPADACETAAAWRVAIENRRGPTALSLTRQKLPILAQCAERATAGVGRGAYVVEDPEGEPDLILIATGSEVALALEARAALAEGGIAARVVSMPSWELFDAQDESYRESVLPARLDKRLAIEAGSPLGWERYVGPAGSILGVDGYGASAPYGDLVEHYGFTASNVVAQARALMD